MELRQIRYFLAVAEERSFSRAAKRLNISQPPLSRSIRKLEESLRVELFNRTTRTVQLTSAGRAFLAKARIVVFEADSAALEALRMAEGCSDVVSIAFMSAVMLAELTPLLREFLRDHRSVTFRFVQMRSDEQLAALIDDRIDVAFVDLGSHFLGGRVEHDELRADLFLHEELCVAVSTDHPFASREVLELQELKGESLAIVERHLFPAHYDTVMAEFRRVGHVPHIGHYANQIPTVLAYAAAGMGVCLAPRCAEPGWAQYVKFIPLRHPIFIDVHMLTKEHASIRSVAQLRESLEAMNSRRRARPNIGDGAGSVVVSRTRHPGVVRKSRTVKSAVQHSLPGTHE